MTTSLVCVKILFTHSIHSSAVVPEAKRRIVRRGFSTRLRERSDRHSPPTPRIRWEIMSIDHSVYLGSDTDPTPTWRQEAPSTSDWPEGAAFSVLFTKPDFPSSQPATCIAYFGCDGWPVGFPEELKDLSDVVKLELQTHPWPWQEFEASVWARCRRRPSSLKQCRCTAPLSLALTRIVPSPYLST